MHTIRLRGPWQLEPIERYIARSDGDFERSTVDVPATARAMMPADWSGSLGRDFLGRVRYHRVFQKPTGLESGERVFLVVEPPRSHGVVTLGGARLGDVVWTASPGRFEITALLKDHNRLEVIVDHPQLDTAMPTSPDDVALPGGLVGEVRLEIED